MFGADPVEGRADRMLVARLAEPRGAGPTVVRLPIRDGRTPTRAARRNIAVGPPSIEQIYYALSLGPGRPEQPPLPVWL